MGSVSVSMTSTSAAQLGHSRMSPTSTLSGTVI